MSPASLRRGEKLLLLTILGLLYLPLCTQTLRHLAASTRRENGYRIARAIKGPDLHGMTTQTSLVSPSPRSWLDGSFQDSASHRFGETFGLRQYLVRVGNQVDYDLFARSHMYSGNVIIGKNRDLYERAYLEDYSGLRPPVSCSELEDLARQLAALQSRLAQHGIAFTLLITPSKAAIYPEDVPDLFRRRPSAAPRSYDRLLPLLSRYKVHYVDGHEITLAAKQQQSWNIFPHSGTHWNDLGAYYTTRALVNQIQTLTGQPLPHIELKSVQSDTTHSKMDSDLADLLNLAVPPFDARYPHPCFAVNRRNCAQDTGRVAFIGGSFTRTPIQILADNQVFRQIDLYYYYRLSFKSFPGPDEAPIDVSRLDWNRQMLGCRTIVLEINEAALGPGMKTPYRQFMTDALHNIP